MDKEDGNMNNNLEFLKSQNSLKNIIIFNLGEVSEIMPEKISYIFMTKLK